MDAKNICSGIAGTSGCQETTRMRWPDVFERRSILPALSAERRCICIMIRCTTSTTPAAQIKNCLRSKAYRYLSPIHVQTVRQDRFQTDALSCPCDPPDFEYVLSWEKLIPQHLFDFANYDEPPCFSHDHQQLVHSFRSNVPKHRHRAHSSVEFQL